MNSLPRLPHIYSPGNKKLTASIRTFWDGTGLAYMIFIALSLALGLLLALRFKVFVLLPATLLLLIGAVATSLSDTLAPKTVTVVLGVTALQLGYFFGLLARSILFGPDPPRKATAPDAEELPIKPAPGSAH